MFGKVEISKLEHKLILFVTSIIPVYALGFILFSLSTVFYEYLFPSPPQPTFAVDDWGAKPTLPIFRVFVVLTLTISFILLFYKRVSLSILTFVLPVISLIPIAFFIQGRVQEILETSADLVTLNHYRETSLVELIITSLDNLNIVFLSFIITLFFWQISILLRMLIKTLQRKTELP